MHSLKSTSLTLGAQALSEEAKHMEAAGKNGDLETVRKENPALTAHFRAFLENLGAFLREQSL